MSKVNVIFAIFAFSLLFTSCQTVDNEMYDLSKDDDPVEYTKDDFPLWMHDLRRAEIIFTGSIPFTILLTNIGYTVYSTFAEGFGEGYSIENFTSSTSMTTEERYDVLKISLSISGLIAAADFVIGFIEDNE